MGARMQFERWRLIPVSCKTHRDHDDPSKAPRAGLPSADGGTYLYSEPSRASDPASVLALKPTSEALSVLPR